MTGLAGPEYDATISFGLPFESEDCPYGESRSKPLFARIYIFGKLKVDRFRGMSLSSLIEQSLREMAGETTPSFASRWRGRFRAAEREDDPRYDALSGKHLQ